LELKKKLYICTSTAQNDCAKRCTINSLELSIEETQIITI